MENGLKVSEVQIAPIKPQNGLVAFASCVINDQFYIGNIALFSFPEGYRIVWPTKKLKHGQNINCVNPITKEADEAVKNAIIEKYMAITANIIDEAIEACERDR